MSANFEALEADFQSAYGLDLREVLWGREALGVRRILALTRGLPPRGATARQLATRGVDWGSVEELLATLVESVDLTNRLLFSAFAKKGSKVWKPVKVRRPTDEPRKPATTEELAQFFGGSVKYTPRGED